MPIIIDNTCDWIGQTIAYMASHHHSSIDTKPEAAEDWVRQVNAVFEATVLPEGARQTRSWYVGANVRGKTVEREYFL